jgi:hypothetical protein
VVTAQDRSVIAGIEAALPLLEDMGAFVKITSGINDEESKKLGGRGDRVRSKLDANSTGPLEALKKAARTVLMHHRKVEAASSVTGSDLTLGRNSFTPGMVKGVCNIAYGMSSMVTYYTSVLYDLGAVALSLANLTSDFCERHFSHLKGATAILTAHNIAIATTHAAARLILQLREYIGNGNRRPPNSNMKRTKARSKNNVGIADSDDEDCDSEVVIDDARCRKRARKDLVKQTSVLNMTSDAVNRLCTQLS